MHEDFCDDFDALEGHDVLHDFGGKYFDELLTMTLLIVLLFVKFLLSLHLLSLYLNFKFK